MRRSARFGTLLLAAGAALALGAAAQARVIVSLADLAQSAHSIGVVRVDEVATVAGHRLARAAVQQPIRRLAKGQSVVFLAEPTWRCDTSDAVVGERVLLFAEPLPAQRFHATKEPAHLAGAAAQRFGKLTPVFLIAWSGRGRIPLVVRNGKAYVPTRGMVIDRGARNLRRTGKEGLVSLPDMAAYVRKATGNR